LHNTELHNTEKAQDTFTGPLFVLGMWRSGTSLLYALLNQHPQIALMYEGRSAAAVAVVSGWEGEVGLAGPLGVLE
jgi:hypothetical protein